MKTVKTTISPEYASNVAVVDFVKNLSKAFAGRGTVLYAKRNVIKRFVVDETDEVLRGVVVKRFKYPNFIQRVAYSFFRSNKAKRAFGNAMELRNRGIDTPREIACIEQWVNGLFGFGYYLSASDDAPPIREKLIEPEEFDRTMAEDFAAFAAQLHEKGILHHDLNSTNVLYHFDGEHYRFLVIDINRMDFFPAGVQPSPHECFDNLTRFTGRMDLFEYVLRCYAAKRGWDIEKTTQEAIAVKNKHDEQWRRRKAFLRKLKAPPTSPWGRLKSPPTGD
ncbi:lipopolysaccharide kinase InaA family protein [Viscerimonas tarda]